MHIRSAQLPPYNCIWRPVDMPQNNADAQPDDAERRQRAANVPPYSPERGAADSGPVVQEVSPPYERGRYSSLRVAASEFIPASNLANNLR
jgi:hypothetical protein